MFETGSAAYDAKQILDTLWALLAPFGYVAFRLIALPAVFQGADDGETSLMNASEPEPSTYEEDRTLIAGVISGLFLFFFLGTAGSDILSLMQNDPAWGLLAGLLGVGLVALAVLVERSHRQNQRYVDLLTDSDHEVVARRQAIEIRTHYWLRIGSVVWAVLFFGTVGWLWKIAHTMV